MRDRHNIVGTEVGRPRQPFYMPPRLGVQKARAARPWRRIVVALALVGVGVALAVIL